MPIQVSGIDEMLKNIEKTGKNIENVKVKSIKKGAEVVAKEASRLCERSDEQSAHIQDHIVVSDVMYGADGEPYVLVGPEKDTQNKFFYGKFLELGTVKMRAKPFLEPATITKHDEAIEEMADIIRGEMNNV